MFENYEWCLIWIFTPKCIRSVCNANFLNIGTFAPNSGWFWRENSNCIFQLKTKLRSSLRSQWSEWFSNNVTLDALDIKTMILLCFFFAIIQFMALQLQPKLDLDAFSERAWEISGMGNSLGACLKFTHLIFCFSLLSPKGWRFLPDTICARIIKTKSRTCQCYIGPRFYHRRIALRSPHQVGKRWIESRAEFAKGALGTMRSHHASH